MADSLYMARDETGKYLWVNVKAIVGLETIDGLQMALADGRKISIDMEIPAFCEKFGFELVTYV